MISTTRSTGSSFFSPQNGFQRAAGHVFHDDVAQSNRDHRIENLHDVRVVELAGQRSFVEKQVRVELAALRVAQDLRERPP
jgi:hypothetical protein